MRSALIDTPYWLDYCQDVFGKEFATKPNTDFINQYTGALNIKGENIIFLNAAEDPWQYASMRQLTKDQSKMVNILIDCNNCAHCVDLHTPSENDSPPL